MPFVLDASVTLCWAFADEEHPVAAAALDLLHQHEAHVPSLWWFEVRNILIVNERRRRLSEAETSAFLRNLTQLAINVHRALVEAALLILARQHRLTVYDAAYLELAQREDMPLATLDVALQGAAVQAGVRLLSKAA